MSDAPEMLDPEETQAQPASDEPVRDNTYTDVLGADLPDEDQDVLYGVEGDTRYTPEAIFVEEYVRTGNAFRACIKAGMQDVRYPMEVVARRALERPEIAAAIRVAREVQEKFAPKAGVGMYTREVMLDELQQVYERALDDRSYAASISAINTQAKLLGFMEQTLNVNVTQSVRELPLAELRRLVADRMPDRVIEGTARVVGIAGKGEG